MLRNLKAEMARRDIELEDIASVTGLCKNSIRNKIQGKSTFSLYAAFAIRCNFFPDIPLEILFEKDSTSTNQNPPA